MERQYPGMWHRWYRHQCVAVGWARKWGFHVAGPAGKKDPGWLRARATLAKVAPGDLVVVALAGHRVGRLGEVTALKIADVDWEPLVPRSKNEPDGEMGRRIEVRWDLACGPESREQVVHLPAQRRLTTGELRPTVCRVQSLSVEDLRVAMNDRANWVGLLPSFAYERSLSDFIAAYPHRLEDGLVPHPSDKLREKVFKDKTRLDVLLLDRSERPVIVECKQHAPSTDNLKQLRHYMKLLEAETDIRPRGILVHGGASRVPADVAAAATAPPAVELVRYHLDVDFSRSG
jgi:hypothetical protein